MDLFWGQHCLFKDYWAWASKEDIYVSKHKRQSERERRVIERERQRERQRERERERERNTDESQTERNDSFYNVILHVSFYTVIYFIYLL